MKVILLKSVPKLGKKDDVVDVSDGYANNALLSKGLATPATSAAVAAINQRKQNAVATRLVQHNLLERAIAALQGKRIEIHARTNTQGTLFSKLDATAIARHLETILDIAIDSRFLTVPGGVIKTVGEYTIDILDNGQHSAIEIRVL